ncbi:hypothetical protein ACQ4PT_026265 [Festuca glaucescens]
MSGAQPVVVFWYGWGIHVMVVLSFLVQVTLLLLVDIRRRKHWPVLNVIIWTGYTLADTTAVYALGHMSVLCSTPEHHLMALWAPLLLVHLGGQDNITAYAIEDNRLWLCHLQTFGLQVVAAGYVLYASTVFSRPSLLRLVTILMSVVGFLKSTRVPAAIMDKVLELVSTAKYGEVGLMSRAQGVNAVRRSKEQELVTLIKGLNPELADSILVWHIATNVYISWYIDQDTQGLHCMRESRQLSDYMLFLLAARPYMLPYPVTRHRYVQLCHDSVTHLRCCTAEKLPMAVMEQKVDLMKKMST